MIDRKDEGEASAFPLGQTVITRTALSTLPAEDVLSALERHARGDWGELDPEDVVENERSLRDDRALAGGLLTREGAMQERQLSFSFERPYEEPCEYTVVALRECPTPEDMQLCDTPQKAAAYWERHIQTDRSFNPERECCAVLMLNTRRRIRGHHIVSVGTLDSNLIHPREVFRAAIIANAAAILLLHNLCVQTHKL